MCDCVRRPELLSLHCPGWPATCHLFACTSQCWHNRRLSWWPDYSDLPFSSHPSSSFPPSHLSVCFVLFVLFKTWSHVTQAGLRLPISGMSYVLIRDELLVFPLSNARIIGLCRGPHAYLTFLEGLPSETKIMRIIPGKNFAVKVYAQWHKFVVPAALWSSEG